ncbi:MAG TPA: DotD/TraH family lipoprotein [Stellaceae bacterium]|nr:DotD/TraH family lipoprotein [Stellaceae bacterium]
MDDAGFKAGQTAAAPFAARRRVAGIREPARRGIEVRVIRLRAAPLLASMLLVAGCAINPVPTDVATPGMPNPQEALQRSMQHVDGEMAELGQLSPSAVRVVQPVMPADLQRVVSFAWRGSLDLGVAKLAASVGYTFYRTAPVNAQPLDIAIRLKSVPAYQVFEALGAEAGARATVEVDPLHHQVEVIHHV